MIEFKANIERKAAVFYEGFLGMLCEILDHSECNAVEVTFFLSGRFTPEEKAMLSALAKRNGLSITGVMIGKEVVIGEVETNANN